MFHLPMILVPGTNPNSPGNYITGRRHTNDIIPTIMDYIGYSIPPPEIYEGKTMFDPIGRTSSPLFSMCWDPTYCTVGYRGNLKVIYYLESQVTEAYDISKDPEEKYPLEKGDSRWEEVEDMIPLVANWREKWHSDYYLLTMERVVDKQ